MAKICLLAKTSFSPLGGNAQRYRPIDQRLIEVNI